MSDNSRSFQFTFISNFTIIPISISLQFPGIPKWKEMGIYRKWKCQYFPFQKLEGPDPTVKCDALTSKGRTPPRRAKLNFIIALRALYSPIPQLCFLIFCIKERIMGSLCLLFFGVKKKNIINFAFISKALKRFYNIKIKAS